MRLEYIHLNGIFDSRLSCPPPAPATLPAIPGIKRRVLALR
jgi:hypothetical protein